MSNVSFFTPRAIVGGNVQQIFSSQTFTEATHVTTYMLMFRLDVTVLREKSSITADD